MSVKATIENNELVLRLPIQTPTPSRTGRNLVVASTHGNMITSAMVKAPGGEERPIIVGVNAYIKP